MTNIIFKLVINVFLFIAIGYILAWFIGNRKDLVRWFINFVIYILFPVFIFLNLWQTKINYLIAGKITLLSLVVLFSGTLFAWMFAKAQKIDFKNVCLPIMLMNSAYLAIPTNGILFGDEGIAYAVIYNVIQTLFSATVGIYAVAGKDHALDVLSLPLVYAAIAGFGLNIVHIPTPEVLQNLLKFMNKFVLPMMLFFVGYRINFVTVEVWKTAVLGSLVRVFGGLVVSIIMVIILSLTGAARGVGIMTSVMPSAVASYIFSELYNSDAKFAAAMIAVSTIASIFYIPLIAYLILSFR